MHLEKIALFTLKLEIVSCVKGNECKYSLWQENLGLVNFSHFQLAGIPTCCAVQCSLQVDDSTAAPFLTGERAWCEQGFRGPWVEGWVKTVLHSAWHLCNAPVLHQSPSPSPLQFLSCSKWLHTKSRSAVCHLPPLPVPKALQLS